VRLETKASILEQRKGVHTVICADNVKDSCGLHDIKIGHIVMLSSEHGPLFNTSLSNSAFSILVRVASSGGTISE
jgi:hypothetical protein